MQWTNFQNEDREKKKAEASVFQNETSSPEVGVAKESWAMTYLFMTVGNYFETECHKKAI